MEANIFLGVDSSTSGCTIVALEQNLSECAPQRSDAQGASHTPPHRWSDVIEKVSVNYDELPEYATREGVHIHDDGETVTQHPIMWVDAFERCLDKLKDKGFPFGKWDLQKT